MVFFCIYIFENVIKIKRFCGLFDFDRIFSRNEIFSNLYLCKYFLGKPHVCFFHQFDFLLNIYVKNVFRHFLLKKIKYLCAAMML